MRGAARGDFTQQEIYDLGVSTFKLQMLDELAKKKAHEIGNDSEELEVMLYYRTQLADRLKLPHQSRDMNFQTEATQDRNGNIVVNRRDLDTAARAVQSAASKLQEIIEFLTEWEPWQKDLARRYPDKFKIDDLEEAQTELHDQLDKLGERSDLNDDDKLQKTAALREEFDKLDGKLFGPAREDLTREFMNSNVVSGSQSKNCTILSNRAKLIVISMRNFLWGRALPAISVSPRKLSLQIHRFF